MTKLKRKRGMLWKYGKSHQKPTCITGKRLDSLFVIIAQPVPKNETSFVDGNETIYPIFQE